jgi:hypothetical protein
MGTCFQIAVHPHQKAGVARSISLVIFACHWVNLPRFECVYNIVCGLTHHDCVLTTLFTEKQLGLSQRLWMVYHSHQFSSRDSNLKKPGRELASRLFAFRMSSMLHSRVRPNSSSETCVFVGQGDSYTNGHNAFSLHKRDAGRKHQHGCRTVSCEFCIPPSEWETRERFRFVSEHRLTLPQFSSHAVLAASTRPNLTSCMHFPPDKGGSVPEPRSEPI